MNCPNCGYEEISNNLCLNCGIDIVLFAKTEKMSDSLYNKGLNQAKLSDLSGAIDSLCKSIEFNKNNCTARNLLGLVYFEMGHIGDGLKQWVISSSILKESNISKDYLDIIQNNSVTLDTLNDAIKMFNQALGYIKQKNDDMAIIQLKKAIETSPKFVDALNLLAFCTLIQKDKERALGLIERVLAIDINNAVAINYYREIFPQKSRPEPIVKKQKVAAIPTPAAPSYTSSYTPLSAKTTKSFGNHFHMAEILSFLIGCCCALAILYILIVPGAIAKKDKETSDLQSSLDTTKQELINTKADYIEKISKLEADNLSLTQENSALKVESELQRKSQKITEAQTAYNAGNAVEAAEAINQVDIAGLPADMATTANNIKKQVFPISAKYYLDEAVAKYNNDKLEDAKASLEKSLIYANNEEFNYMDKLIYYMGLIAEGSKDIDSAKKYYSKIINDYPKSSYFNKAKSRYNNLQ